MKKLIGLLISCRRNKLMHSYEEYNEPIQKLIKCMQDDYPHEFTLEICSFGAELKADMTIRTFLGEEWDTKETPRK